MMNTKTYLHVSEELVRARNKFPDTNHMFDALVEEVGELAKALLEQEQEKHKGVTSEDVYAEAIQCAAMAIRMVEEGDKSYPLYKPDDGRENYEEK